MARPTIKDVAALAGVSAPTASRAINGIRVNADAARRVEQAVEALGFQRNAFARGLLLDRSSIIAMVMGETGPDVPGEFQRHAVEACRRRSYHLVADQVLKASSAQRLVDALVSRLRPDGLILWSPAADDLHVITSLIEAKVPYVRIQGDPRKGPTIGVDASATADAAFEIARASQAQRVIYARGGEPAWASAARSRSLSSVVKRSGAAVALETVAAQDFEAGLSLGAAETAPDRTAFICDSSGAALGVNEALRRRGTEASAIICFQDTAALRLTSGHIRRQVLPVREMAEAAISQIVAGDRPPGPQSFASRFL
ncbi:LacI family DNA-binding transcriptional regulator [Brevundimonas intermedia]|uniref:LacI family DNA-binding transcriptional regulator n=1 Tax=Brevundimonas intermedia TaxID=74315 RepID=UPI003209171B